MSIPGWSPPAPPRCVPGHGSLDGERPDGWLGGRGTGRQGLPFHSRSPRCRNPQCGVARFGDSHSHAVHPLPPLQPRDALRDAVHSRLPRRKGIDLPRQIVGPRRTPCKRHPACREGDDGHAQKRPARPQHPKTAARKPEGTRFPATVGDDNQRQAILLFRQPRYLLSLPLGLYPVSPFAEPFAARLLGGRPEYSLLHRPMPSGAPASWQSADRVPHDTSRGFIHGLLGVRG